jgi:hypothetical protein
MPTKPFDKSKIPRIPLEYYGKWIAWSADRTQIVAHDKSFPALWQAVREAGVEDPIFEKVPRSDVLFIGRL